MMGMDVARAIRESDANTAIVFVTMSPDFAVDDFSIHALHYLLKPVSETDIDTFELLGRKVEKLAHGVLLEHN